MTVTDSATAVTATVTAGAFFFRLQKEKGGEL